MSSLFPKILIPFIFYKGLFVVRFPVPRKLTLSQYLVYSLVYRNVYGIILRINICGEVRETGTGGGELGCRHHKSQPISQGDQLT